jgi:hypothetical protein
MRTPRSAVDNANCAGTIEAANQPNPVLWVRTQAAVDNLDAFSRPTRQISKLRDLDHLGGRLAPAIFQTYMDKIQAQYT